MIKVILFAFGAIAGGILSIVLKDKRILPADFDGRWIGVALAIIGLIVGHHFDNKRECAQIARELEQDSILRDQNKGDPGR